MNKKIKRVFPPAPLNSFRSAKKLSSQLDRAKFYPLKKIVSSFQCSGKCVKLVIMQKKQLFTSTITGKFFEMSIKNLLVIITVWFFSLRVRFF